MRISYRSGSVGRIAFFWPFSPKVTIMSKPTRKVFAATPYKANGLVLLPETMAVGATNEQVPAGAIPVETSFENTPGVTYYLSAPAMSTDPSKRTFVSPFWMCRASFKEEECNLVVVRRSIDVGCRLKADKKEKETSVSSSVSIPVFKNKKSIAQGEELVYFAGTAPFAGLAEETAASSSSSKKRRQQ